MVAPVAMGAEMGLPGGHGRRHVWIDGGCTQPWVSKCRRARATLSISFAAAFAIFPILPNPPLVHSSGSREDIMDPVPYGFGRWDRMEASEAARRCGTCISTTRRFWPLLLGLLLGRHGRDGGSAQ